MAAAVIAASVAPPGVARAASTNALDPATSVAVTSWGTNRVDLFARGTDGALKHKLYNGRWSAWESLGGAISSAPAAVSWGVGRIDVVARGIDGSVVHRAFLNGAWAPWDAVGSPITITGEPSIASWGPDRLDVVVRGAPGNNVLQVTWTGSGWTPWADLGGIIDASPAAVSWGPNRLDIFAKAGGTVLFHKYWDNGWSGWMPIDSGITSAPAVTSAQAGYLDIYARIGGNRLGHKAWAGSFWTGIEDLGGSLATAPGATDWNYTREFVFGMGTDGGLKQLVWDGVTGWGTWQSMADNPPATPVAPYTPTMAVQVRPVEPALVGGLEYAYVDNIGRIVVGHQPDPANTNSLQWTPISGNEAFSGPLGLIEQTDGKLQVSSQHASGDVWARVQTAKGASTWAPWLDQGGQFASPVVVARQTDDSTVLFARDTAGGLWWLNQSAVGGQYGTWTSLGVTGLVGPPTVVAVQDGLAIFALGAGGTVRTATLFPSGVVSPWTSLGGSGYTGRPAAIVFPGYRIRLFMRTGSGTIVTKMQDATLAWPATWTAVGTQTTAGSPAAVLSPLSGKTEIVVRGTDSNIYSTGETLQGSGTWRPWIPVLLGTDTAATDPTVLSFNDGIGLRWGFVFRNADQQSRLYTVDSSGTAGLTAGGTPPPGAPKFTAYKLPNPPR